MALTVEEIQEESEVVKRIVRNNGNFQAALYLESLEKEYLKQLASAFKLCKKGGKSRLASDILAAINCSQDQ